MSTAKTSKSAAAEISGIRHQGLNILASYKYHSRGKNKIKGGLARGKLIQVGG